MGSLPKTDATKSTLSIGFGTSIGKSK
jgi:hypothetical protein